MRSRTASLVVAAALRLSLRTPPLVASFAVVAGLALAATPSAQASLSREVTLRHLVTLADVVVEGTPEEHTSVWEDRAEGGRRIVTYTRVSVSQVAAGDVSAKDVWVRTLGGQVGRIGQRVEGEAVLAIGERTMLFLKLNADGATHTVAEMAQGQYLVKPTDSGHRVHPSPFVGGLVPNDRDPEHKSAREVLTGKLIDEAIVLVRGERTAAGK